MTMAGIWERLTPPNDDRVTTLLLSSGLKAYYANVLDVTVGATRAELKADLNSYLESPLAGAELTDLDGILDTLDGQPNINASQGFLMLAEWVFLSAELNNIDETKFRNDLGI